MGPPPGSGGGALRLEYVCSEGGGMTPIAPPDVFSGPPDPAPPVKSTAPPPELRDESPDIELIEPIEPAEPAEPIEPIEPWFPGLPVAPLGTASTPVVVADLIRV